MYVVTFYSYKGGVGRTMALVNTAYDLASRGRRVLIVDFDLEAPGISSFDEFDPATQSQGMVDFVCDYIKSGQAPLVDDYIVECSSQISHVPTVWVMPAGKRDPAYSGKLASIDWQRLYSEHEGFLMFEDLRQQWLNYLQPKFDYVLIDSRTGHTDVGGICTRQLPNSVVLMFYPNRQNIIGLSSVAEEIRKESPQRHDEIELLFCPSNVPDLDDEKEILLNQMDNAKVLLGYDEPASVLHHYNSLDLLDQVVFINERPRTKLSDEYRRLTTALIRRNLADKDGALAELEAIKARLRGRQDVRVGRGTRRIKNEGVDGTVKKIESLHPDDGEIAWSLAPIYNEIGEIDSEIAALTLSIEKGFRPVRALRFRAARRLQQGQKEEAIADLKLVLAASEATGIDVAAASDLLRQSDTDWVKLIEQSNVLGRLAISDKVRLGNLLSADRKGARLAAEFLFEEFEADNVRKNQIYSNPLVLAQIGSGQFELAIKTFGWTRNEILSQRDLATAFNYAMAEWGLIGSAPQDLLRRVVELAAEVYPEYDANFHQCLALAYGVIGQSADAKEQLALSRSALGPGSVFSCWRYLRVNRTQMMADLDAIEAGLENQILEPAFIDREMQTQ